MVGIEYALQGLGFGLIAVVSVLAASNKITKNDTLKVITQILVALMVIGLVIFIANPMLGNQVMCEVTHIMGARTAEGTSASCVMNQ